MTEESPIIEKQRIRTIVGIKGSSYLSVLGPLCFFSVNAHCPGDAIRLRSDGSLLKTCGNGYLQAEDRWARMSGTGLARSRSGPVWPSVLSGIARRTAG